MNNKEIVFSCVLTQEQHDQIWKHLCSVENNQGAIGGRITWSFTPTGLGTICEVSCACGWKKDFTRDGEW